MNTVFVNSLLLAAGLSLALLPRVPSWQDKQATDISDGTSVEREIGPGRVEAFRLRLRRGESAHVDVLQIGVDVVIDVVMPDGRRMDTVDGPTGRAGVETVEITAAADGLYTLAIRPFDAGVPSGKFRLTVRWVRDANATLRLMNERRRARMQAATWLRGRSAILDLSAADEHVIDPSALRGVVGDARVIGLGEATHGSREFNDARFALTKQLVKASGCRLIALEFSASRARELAPVSGGKHIPAAVRRSHTESIWIGSRIREKLYEWVHSWNTSHAGKDRVTIIGVDAGDNGVSRTRLFDFLGKAYTSKETTRWAPAEKEFREADAQTTVFGNSGVDAQSRSAIMEIQARLLADRPMLEMRFGAGKVAAAIEDTRTLFEYADFNAEGDAASRSRDWYMAMRILSALPKDRNSRVVYWAHNAHVAATAGGFQTTGRILRQALGERYRPIAATCGAGSFVAQIPNDVEDRLAVSPFLPHQGEAIEDVLSLVRPGRFVAYWNSRDRGSQSARRLREPQPMHWIGGLYAPNGPPSSQYRSFRLIRDFDAVVYLPEVAAEKLPQARPVVPARKRTPTR